MKPMWNIVTRWWPSLLFPFVVLGLLFPIWGRGEVLAFQDSLHFYYPYWTYLDSREGLGRLIPMWNPYDGFGCSVIGEPTSMIFYPLRWIALVPTYATLEQRIGVFVAIHFFLSYTAWIWGGARNRWSPILTQFAAWGYSLSGPVFYLIYNPPFLVGAAWLPFAMFAIADVMRRPSVIKSGTTGSTLRAAIPLAMMALGGDAQCCYHVILVAALWSIGIAITDLARSWRAEGRDRDWLRNSVHRLRFVALSALLAGAFSAVQIVPTYLWLQLSVRKDVSTINSNVASIEANQSARANELERAIDREHMLEANRLDYSVAPFHMVTCIWPNILGSYTPANTRWSQIFASDGRVWVPSLHVGTSLFLVWLSLLWFTRKSNQFAPFVAFSAIGIFAFFCSLPYGLYQVLQEWLPFYESFRFPAKWSPFFVWGICAAVASAEEPLRQANSNNFHNIVRRMHQIVLVLSGVSVALIFATRFGGFGLNSLDRWLREMAYHPFMGRFDPEAAMRVVGGSTVWTASVAATLGLLSRPSTEPQPKALGFSSRSVILLMAMTIGQLTWSAQCQVSSVVPDMLHRSVALATSYARASVGAEQSEGRFDFWKFGESELLTAIEVYASDDILEPISVPERQARVLTAKFHLLAAVDRLEPLEGFGLRNLQSHFSLFPRAILDASESASYKPWKHHTLPLDSDEPLEQSNSKFQDESDDRELAKFTEVVMRETSLSFRYQAERAFQLELPILQDGGWSSIRNESIARIQRTDDGRLLVDLRAGDHHIELEYVTPGIYIGATISCVSIALAIAVVLVLPRNARSKTRHD